MSNLVLLKVSLLYCTFVNVVRIKYIRVTLKLSHPRYNKWWRGSSTKEKMQGYLSLDLFIVRGEERLGALSQEV